VKNCSGVRKKSEFAGVEWRLIKRAGDNEESTGSVGAEGNEKFP